MGILQEYKFFLIIAVISLAWLAVYFLNWQSHYYYNEYLWDLRENYSRIKTLNSWDQNLYSVFNLSDSKLKGLWNWLLLGQSFNKKDIYVTDLFDDSTWVFYSWAINKWEFWISIWIRDDIDWNSIQNSKRIKDTINSENIWNLEQNGRIIFIFNSEEEVDNLIEGFISDGKKIPVTEIVSGVTENKWLAVNFY